MVRFGIALSLFLSASSVESFQASRMVGIGNTIKIPTRQRRVNVQRNVSSSSSPDYGEASLSDAFNSVTNAARDQLANEFSNDPDAEEEEISQRKQMVERRRQTYKVQLPLTSSRLDGKSDVLTIGMSLRQINKGRTFDDKCLNLDTLEWENRSTIKSGDKYENFDEQGLLRRIDGEYQGTVVSSVLKGGAAWTAGVRPGDMLQATSATMGSQMWPKSTVEGVRSAMLSRKASSSSIEMEFQRIGDAIDNQYELSLSKPIGMQLKETDDGYVVVTGFTQNAPTLVRYAVKVGDRVIAVDSSLGGKMWPVSTVEGVVSAVTARLPGQEITFRFERPSENMETEGDIAVQSTVLTSNTVKTEAKSKVNNEELLQRCRGIIKRYSNSEGTKSSFVGKYDVPGLIADKVLEALSSAEAKIDAVTLSMIMGAYLSCKQANKAIDAFEAATGLSGSGRNKEATLVENLENIIPNPEALNIFTASALLKAHAMVGDLDSVERVLAAVDGKAGLGIGDLETASWAVTGVGGTLTPDTRFYNTALSAAAKSRGELGLELALRIFDDMADPTQKKSEKQKDLVSYNTLLNALTNCQRYQEAVNLFYQMKSFGIKPDKYSYTSLAQAIVSDVDVGGDIEEVIYDMKEQGVSPDIATFNTAIKALCSQRRISAAKRVVGIMEDCGVSPDSITYGYLMKSLIDSGKASAALTLFETACSERRTVALTENPYLYTTAISAAASLRDHERALELLARMSSIGIQPSLKTLTAVMGACLSAGKPELATSIFEKIKKPDAYALTQGAEALCKSGEPSLALSIVSKNQGRRGLLKGKLLMKSFKTILYVSLERGDFSMAREALTTLIRGGNLPSRDIYEACFEAMKLFPKRRKAFQVAGETDELATQKFQFLLFLLDSIAGRKLPCEGSLYSAVLNYGFSIGGLAKKIATMLVSARINFSNDKKLIEGGDEAETVPFFANWETLFLQYNEAKSRIATNGLPRLLVRVSSRDIPNVLKAEKNLSFKRKQLV